MFCYVILYYDILYHAEHIILCNWPVFSMHCELAEPVAGVLDGKLAIMSTRIQNVEQSWTMQKQQPPAPRDLLFYKLEPLNGP